jgi:hypothetical protein
MTSPEAAMLLSHLRGAVPEQMVAAFDLSRDRSIPQSFRPVIDGSAGLHESERRARTAALAPPGSRDRLAPRCAQIRPGSPMMGVRSRAHPRALR